MKVISYMAGIPARNKNPEKPLILQNFIEGVLKKGDNGVVSNSTVPLNCDVAVLQGFIHEASPNTPHLQVRRKVIDFQKQNNNKTIIVDSNLFLYINKSNPGNFLRYSFDGVFPTTGNYFSDHPDPNRWKKISAALNLKLKPWRQTGNHILICMQRNGGWSMKGLDTWQWLSDTITKIRHYTDRPIIVRGHPGDKNSKRILTTMRFPIPIPLDNVHFSDLNNRTLVQDLTNAWATVVYNSSPSVASAIEGVPVFALDKVDCQANEVVCDDISLIENPIMPDRQKWIEKISMCHWNFDELKSGEAWTHIREYAIRR